MMKNMYKNLWGEVKKKKSWWNRYKKFFPEITSRTINRIAMLTYFGPLYAAFVLAGFAVKGTLYGFDDKKETTSQEEDKPEKKKEKFFEKKFSRRSLFTLSYLKDL